MAEPVQPALPAITYAPSEHEGEIQGLAGGGEPFLEGDKKLLRYAVSPVAGHSNCVAVLYQRHCI